MLGDDSWVSGQSKALLTRGKCYKNNEKAINGCYVFLKGWFCISSLRTAVCTVSNGNFGLLMDAGGIVKDQGREHNQ